MITLLGILLLFISFKSKKEIEENDTIPTFSYSIIASGAIGAVGVCLIIYALSLSPLFSLIN